MFHALTRRRRAPAPWQRLLRAGLYLALASTVGSATAWVAPAEALAAAPKKKTKKPAAAAPETTEPEAAPTRPQPASPTPAPSRPEPAPATPPPPVVQPGVQPAPAVAAPLPPAPPTPPPVTVDAPKPRPKPLWQGFFLQFNVGYADAGGTDGPAIPALTTGSNPPPAGTPAFSSNDPGYKRAVTTNRGSGVAAALEIGYNVSGYVSMWADLSWHGSFGSTADIAGAGTAAAMLGFHPLRFVRDGQLPVDLRLYGGFGFFDILYYYETEFQLEAKGKAWIGTAIPFGASLQYRFDDEGVFTMGGDLRFVQGRYTKWVYRNDNPEISSKLSDPETTLRTEPRVVFGWHF